MAGAVPFFSVLLEHRAGRDLFGASPVTAGLFRALLDVFILPLFFGAYAARVFSQASDTPSRNLTSRLVTLITKCKAETESSQPLNSFQPRRFFGTVNQATLRRPAFVLSVAAVSSSLTFSSAPACLSASLPASFNLPTAF